VGDVFIIRPDGTDLMRVTSSAGQDLFPVWAPQGLDILVQSTRDLNAELYLVTLGSLPER
jgi:Tol biopolymer transport system component